MDDMLMGKLLDPVFNKIEEMEELFMKNSAKKNAEIKKLEKELVRLEKEALRIKEDNSNLVETLKKISGLFNENAEQLEGYKELCSEKEAYISNLEAEYSAVKHELETNRTAYIEVGGDLSAKETQLTEIMRRADEYEFKLKDTLERLESAENERDGYRLELVNAKVELDSTKKMLSEIEDRFNKTNARLSETRDKLEETDSQLSAVWGEFNRSKTDLSAISDELKTAKESIKAYRHEKNAFVRAVAPYAEILESAYECKSMRGYFESKGLSGDVEDIDNIIKYINLFSDEFTFAREVCLTLRNYKNSNPEPLDEKELALITMINEYYSTKYSLDYNVLNCFGIEENKSVIKFDRKKMRHMKQPSGADFIEISAVYVPALMRSGGVETDLFAYVEGIL